VSRTSTSPRSLLDAGQRMLRAAARSGGRTRRRNPPVGMSDALGAIVLVHSMAKPFPVGVMLVAPRKRASGSLTPFDVVGMLTFSVEDRRATVDRAAAEPGFGPLLYDAAAYVARTAGAGALFPSTERTEAAEGFWERIPEGFLPALSKDAFAKKYGGGIDEAVKRGLVYGPFTDVLLTEAENGFWVGIYPFSNTLSSRAKRAKVKPARAITARQSAREYARRAEARAQGPQGTLGLLYRQMNYGKDAGKTYLVLTDYLGDAPRGLSDIVAVGHHWGPDVDGGTFVGEQGYVQMLEDLARFQLGRMSSTAFRAKHGLNAETIVDAGADVRRDFGAVSIPYLEGLWQEMVRFPSVEPSVREGDLTRREPWIESSYIVLPEREEAPLRVGTTRSEKDPRRRLVRKKVQNPEEKTSGEKALSTAQTVVGTAGIAQVATRKLAPKVAARVGATVAGRAGARAIPVLGEVLMLFGAGKEAYKVGKRRLKGEGGSWKTDIAKVGAGAIGLEDFVPEAEPEKKANPRRVEHPTLTGADRKWFAGSKVVGDNGLPLVLYHGSQDPNLKFRRGRSVYATSSYRTAERFADGSYMSLALEEDEVPTVYVLLMHMTNPKVFTTEEEYERYFQDVDITPEDWKRQGYDGLIYLPEDEHGDPYYAVFGPEQVRVLAKHEIV